MEREKFLERARAVSMLKSGICGTKAYIPDRFKVIYSGIVFFPIGYKIFYKNGIENHIAILHDLYCNSVIECALERVKKYSKEEAEFASVNSVIDDKEDD